MSPPCSGSEGGAVLATSLGLAESMAASAGEAADMEEAEIDMLLHQPCCSGFIQATTCCLCLLLSLSQAAIAGGNCG